MNKKSFIAGIIIVLIFIAVGLFSIKTLGPSQQKDKTPVAIEKWEQALLSLNANIAFSIVDPVLDNDTYALRTYLSGVKNSVKGFEYLIVVNKDGKILLHPDSSQILQDYKPEGLKPLGDQKNLIQHITKGQQDVYDIATPIMLEGIKQGEVHLAVKNPWEAKTEKTADNLPKILFIVAGVLGIIISIIGAVGSRGSAETALPSISREEIEKLKIDKQGLESKIIKLNKDFADISKKKKEIAGSETEITNRIAQLRIEEMKLLKSIDEKKGELIKFEQQMEAMSASASSPEIESLKNQLVSKDEEIDNLQNQLENLKAQAGVNMSTEEVLVGNIEGMKKEELEITQRIVKKRREEIILSQRVETKRKEELALERKIEALRKKLKEMGSSS